MEVPYHYYYARYLLIELIPSAILLSACFLGNFDTTYKRKILNILLISITLIYLIPLSLYQFNKQENTNTKEFLKISQQVSSNDLLYLSIENFGIHNDLIKSPLLGYNNLQVFSIFNLNDLSTPELKRLNSNYENVFILSGENINFNLTNTIKEIDEIHYQIKHFSNGKHAMDSQLNRSNISNPLPVYNFLPPIDYVIKEKTLFLYKLNN